MRKKWKMEATVSFSRTRKIQNNIFTFLVERVLTRVPIVWLSSDDWDRSKWG